LMNAECAVFTGNYHTIALSEKQEENRHFYRNGGKTEEKRRPRDRKAWQGRKARMCKAEIGFAHSYETPAGRKIGLVVSRSFPGSRYTDRGGARS